ncbi:3-hydroxyacyl-CoA dehydrogenase family protein [Thermodesulfobacteriota bacterium]
MRDVLADKIQECVVVGAGIMGAGIAQNFAQAGIHVSLVDQENEVLNGCLSQIDANLKLFSEFGLVDEDVSTIKNRITPCLAEDLTQVMDRCDFLVEAIPEILELKKDLFGQLDSLPRHVILASNTSSFTITSIAEGLQNPGRIVGLHYFNPAHIIPAVEIHRGKHTSEDTVNVTRELMLRVGKKPIIVQKTVPGFIINRLTGAMEREIDYLIDNGIVTPEDLDTAVKASYGFRLACLGPMEAEDMIGLDTSARVSERMFKVLSNSTEPSPKLLEKVDKGELGIKSGKGWYDYTGRNREEVAEKINRRLLKQLALFKSVEG